jgi:nucleoside-diphosphate-sugar epimerase
VPRSKRQLTVFVTGATGFLGGHLLRMSSDRGWRLRCLSRQASPPGHRHVRWVQGDLRDPRSWSGELEGCDAIVHLATASLTDAEREPAAARAVIVDGFQTLAGEAARRGVKRWILSSTAEVFGSPRKLPIRETAPSRPLSAYGRLKAEAERVATRRAEEAAASLTVLRFFNLYGPAADGCVPATVIRAFTERLVANQPIVLHASRTNSRDFLHVRDAVRTLLAVLERPGVSGLYNVGSGRETPLLELAMRIGAILGLEVTVDFRPREGRRRRLVADVSKAAKELRVRPSVDLDEGLAEVVRLLRRT